MVAVAGSIGKTTAKIAIATIVAEHLRVRLFHGNRGDGFIDPLAILGIDYPGGIKGWRAWHAIYKAARRRIKQPTDVDVVIMELTSTEPGSIARYANYVQPDITVVTSVTESNLETFGTLDAIGQEQLGAANISKAALISKDDVDGAYAQFLTNATIATYGVEGMSEYRFEATDYSFAHGYRGNFYAAEWSEPVQIEPQVYDEFTLRQVVAACAVGVKVGLTASQIFSGVQRITPLNGHMARLRGVEDSSILDNTATNSPLGSKNSLQALYQISAPQRIAVIGAMHKLGHRTAAAHQEVGMLCDGAQLAWVVTVGADANRHSAPAARARGCQVKECQDAIEAGAFVRSVLEPGGVVLFDGPESGIYLEEAVKIVLHTASDADRLVRQTPEDIAHKQRIFSRFA